MTTFPPVSTLFLEKLQNSSYSNFVSSRSNQSRFLIISFSEKKSDGKIIFPTPKTTPTIARINSSPNVTSLIPDSKDVQKCEQDPFKCNGTQNYPKLVRIYDHHIDLRRSMIHVNSSMIANIALLI